MISKINSSNCNSPSFNGVFKITDPRISCSHESKKFSLELYRRFSSKVLELGNIEHIHNKKEVFCADSRDNAMKKVLDDLKIKYKQTKEHFGN